MLGISYDGFTSLMALVHPHPALRRRCRSMPWSMAGWATTGFTTARSARTASYYAHDQEATRGQQRHAGGPIITMITTRGWRRVPPANMARLHGLEQLGFCAQADERIRPMTSSGRGRRSTSCWRSEPLTVPIMLVHSLWDQEDIYGNIAVCKAIKPKDTAGQQGLPGAWVPGSTTSSGWTAAPSAPITFGSDTAALFPRTICCSRSSIIS